MSAPSIASASMQEEDEDVRGMDTQTGIGIGIAIAVSIMLLLLAILWLLRRLRHRRRKAGGIEAQRDTFESFGSTLVSSRRSIPLQDLHEKDGRSLRRGSEMMTPANSHEASAMPRSRQGDGGPQVAAARRETELVEMPTIWNEGYRGRPGLQIRRDSEMPEQEAIRTSTGEMARRSPVHGAVERPVNEASKRSSEDAQYTFFLDRASVSERGQYTKELIRSQELEAYPSVDSIEHVDQMR